ncbi:unknown [Salmonella phage FelixO1]|uniref:Uncharacterized protein n=1 Tax=Salmonella phage Felix O1 (isolate Felix O1-VT1) TaxID=1283336 RepID=Q6KGB4_BPFO1|nr:unknown [Salmonella phage FelixO1]
MSRSYFVEIPFSETCDETLSTLSLFTSIVWCANLLSHSASESNLKSLIKTKPY